MHCSMDVWRKCLIVAPTLRSRAAEGVLALQINDSGINEGFCVFLDSMQLSPPFNPGQR
jgi:hypothetical protein